VVSVCIPSYRAEPFLRATLQSVLDQTFGDWELVLVDDASPDRSWEIAQELREHPRVRLERNPTNLGASATWNRALAMAQGRFVKLLCSDDVLRPTCLARQVEALEAHDGAVMASARRDIIDATGKVVLAGRGLRGLRGEVPGPAALAALVRTGENLLGEPSSVLFRTDVLRAVGGFDQEAHYTLDLSTYAAVLRHGSVVCLDDVLATFRISATSWSATLLREQARQARHFYRDLAVQAGLDPRSVPARVGRVRATLLSYLRMAAFARASRRGPGAEVAVRGS